MTRVPPHYRNADRKDVLFNRTVQNGQQDRLFKRDLALRPFIAAAGWPADSESATYFVYQVPDLIVVQDRLDYTACRLNTAWSIFWTASRLTRATFALRLG